MKKLLVFRLILICTLLSLIIGGCGNSKVASEDEFGKSFNEYTSELGKQYLNTTLAIYTRNTNVELRYDNPFKDYIQANYPNYGVEINDLKIDDLVVEYNNYQLCNNIVNLIPSDLFSVIIEDGFVYYGNEYGFYIRTIPVVEAKKPVYDNYINFTPNKYYESTVIVFRYSIDGIFNSEKNSFDLNEKYYCLGMYVFHTTTNNNDMKYFPDSDIPYTKTTILYEDITYKGLGNVEMTIDYNKDENFNIESIQFSGLESSVNKRSIEYFGTEEIVSFDYTISVTIKDNYNINNECSCQKKLFYLIKK